MGHHGGTMESLQEIPNKEHFKMNEICGLLGVKPYVLRFWEAEFPEISPIESPDGKKLYTRKDIESISLIKKLLFEDKLNIEKAKMELKIILSSREMLEEENSENQEEPQAIQLVEKTSTEMIEDDLSWEKIGLAKEKLNEIVSMTQTLKEQHHWS